MLVRVRSKIESNIGGHVILSIKEGIVIIFWLPACMGKKFKVIVFCFDQCNSVGLCEFNRPTLKITR